jgi:hypothetical protein
LFPSPPPLKTGMQFFGTFYCTQNIKQTNKQTNDQASLSYDLHNNTSHVLIISKYFSINCATCCSQTVLL